MTDAELKLKEIAGMRVNIASISDIHLHHPNTPTYFILKNLLTYGLPFNDETAKLDIIFIAGDFTDSAMDFASKDAVLIRKWVAEFLRFCAKHDIIVRVLEGTPLHDWGQSIMFVEENDNHQIGCDLKYIKDIYIEHIERYNLDILYIPDEARPTTEDTWQVVKTLMAERKLEKVDFAIMHGAFAYQLPMIDDIKDKVHSEENYLSIVRHYIFIGHIHQHVPKGKIIPHGSFDRLRHNEEDIKGHVRLLKGSLEFIPNHGAMRYITLDVSGLSVGDILELVEQRLKGSHDPFNIRLLAKPDDVAFGMSKRLLQTFPYGKFDITNIDRAKQRKERKAVRHTRAMALPTLTRSNLLEEWSKDIELAAPEQYKACMKIAESIVHAIR